MEDPQCNEAAKMLWELVPYTRGLGLDVGCGPAKAFPHFIGVDNRKDTAMFGIAMNPDITVPDGANLTMWTNESLDFIFSSHMLEHVEDYKGCLREWWRLLKEGGHLCLYLPHKSFYPNIGQPGANRDHKHDFLPQDIVDAMLEVGQWDLLRNDERNGDQEYSFFQVYKKLAPNGGCKYSYQKPRPPKTCGVVRYGAWGDALQMSSILPGLKQQGYHITLYTVPRAHEILKHNPHIDEFILQDTDQVPNLALGHFWENERKKYDKWINLSESVEATWLTLADRPHTSQWPQAVRAKYLNTNYVEFQHELAGIPYTKPETKFYSTPEEREWVAAEKERLGAAPLILWVLNGSSIHKVWPHIDQIYARLLLTYPNCKIVTVGDVKSLALDEPWKNEARIVRMAGKWTFRQTLAFAEGCDLVVGPETGVLNAVSMCSMPKIVFLSHSSHDNLTRDWENTYALFSTKTPCYPCHKMHYNWSTCKRNEDTGQYWEGTAQCQVDLPAEACWEALTKALGGPASLIITPDFISPRETAHARSVPAL